MSKLHVEASHIIHAQPTTLYAIMSDYKVGHRAVLPRPYFEEMIVDKGGQGAGTELTISMQVFGIKQQFRQRVTEPQPGRVLAESNIGNDLVTTFTFEPLPDGEQTRVTIATEFTPKHFMERLMNPPIMRHIYKKELRNLAEYAHQNR